MCLIDYSCHCDSNCNYVKEYQLKMLCFGGNLETFWDSFTIFDISLKFDINNGELNHETSYTCSVSVVETPIVSQSFTVKEDIHGDGTKYENETEKVKFRMDQ